LLDADSSTKKSDQNGLRISDINYETEGVRGSNMYYLSIATTVYIFTVLKIIDYMLIFDMNC